jgi:hypothetical protein
MFRPILTVLFLVLMMACHDSGPTEDLVDERTVFTFLLPSETTGSASDHWIVLKDDETGDVVDSREIKIGETAEFKSRKKLNSGKLAVTIVSTLPLFAHMSVYAGVPVGSNWSLLKPAALVNSPTETPYEYTAHLYHIPGLLAFSLSDKYGQHGDIYYNLTSVEGPFHTSGAGLKQLISVAIDDENPRYVLWSGVTEGSVASFSYENLTEFDKTVQMAFPETPISATVLGYEGSPGFSNSFVVYDNTSRKFIPRSDLKLGFLDLFPNYKIDLTIGPYTYKSQGPAPSTIPYVSPTDFDNAPRAITNFNITTKQDYSFVKSSYYGGKPSNFDIEYFAPVGQKNRFGPLDDELANKLGYDENKISFTSTEVFMFDSYDSYIKENFVTFDPSRTYIRASVLLNH